MLYFFFYLAGDPRDLHVLTPSFPTRRSSYLDPPEHAKYRAFANPLFTPAAMAKLEDKIRKYAVEYVEGFRSMGECEFMSEFAFEFPIKVFLELMGLPL